MPLMASTPEKVSICNHIVAAGNITINQPEALAKLLEHTPKAAADEPEAAEASEQHTQQNTRVGYRVQVFDDNNPRTARSQAEATHRRISAEFPEMRSYVTFNSPYWRVKAGDFRTRAEAEAAMAEIKAAFPALAGYIRVVRDKIYISE